GKRAFLEDRRQVVQNPGNDVVERLRQDHLPGRDEIAEAERPRRLRLALRQALYAAANDLRKIGRLEADDRDHDGGERAEREAEDDRPCEEDPEDQHEKRSSADEIDEGGGGPHKKADS